MAFVGEKEEGLVLLDRAANGAAIHVVPQLGSDSTAAAVDRGEETRGIHRVVAEVFVQTPMQLIGPGLRRRHHHATSGCAELGRRAVGQQFDFCYGIRRQVGIDQGIADAAVLRAAAIDV